jgi:cysteine desulfurase
MRVYFDNASTTPLLPEVINEMHEMMLLHHGNPSSIHQNGRYSRSIIEKARKVIANTINASLGEVFFTSCATESNNLVLQKSIEDLNKKHIIIGATEHHCVLHTVDHLVKRYGVEKHIVPVDNSGEVHYEVLEELLKDLGSLAIVSIMHGNNEIGTINDIDRIAQLCQENGAIFHSDTVQTITKVKIDVQATPVTFISGSAHKFFGPKGIGFVYINNDVKISPLIHGGGQERNMRAGTENLYGIAGMAKAMEIGIIEMDKRRELVNKLKHYFIKQLKSIHPEIIINGSLDGLYHILSVSFPPSPKADLLMFNLDIAGISASSASACSSGIEMESHVLQAIGHDPKRKTIRFSLSHYNTIKEINYTIEQLKQLTPALSQ